MLHIVLLVTLSSMVFIYPFDNQFRFTLGVAVLSALLLFFTEVPVVMTVLLSGASIIVCRIVLAFILGDQPLSVVCQTYAPAIAYYVVFSIMFLGLAIRRYCDRFLRLVLLLSIADSLGNIVQMFFWPDISAVGYGKAAAGLIALACVRSVIGAYGYMLLKRYQVLTLLQEQGRRYSELMLMTARLKTELFYLKKSSHDIESVMERSYRLYNQLKQTQSLSTTPTEAVQALAIARDIHEIKKDYTRVIAGVEQVLTAPEVEQWMRLSELFVIMRQNIIRYLAITKSDIIIEFQCGCDFITDCHYILVSLLDNLIMNAIEACGSGGAIKISQYCSDGNCIFVVADNGIGIKADALAVLFNPGYSSKFSPVTGKMSTGLGLYHVKNLTEGLGGTVAVSTGAGQGTVFTVIIPEQKLKLSTEQHDAAEGV